MGGRVEFHLQDSHEYGKPKLLHTQQRVSIGSPFAQLDVVGISHDDKHPCCLKPDQQIFFFFSAIKTTYRKTKPADKSVVPLKNIVVIVADPGKGAKNRDDNQDIGNNAASHHGAVLNRAMANNIDNLVDQPAKSKKKNISR